jgi:hypothetical protein
VEVEGSGFAPAPALPRFPPLPLLLPLLPALPCPPVLIIFFCLCPRFTGIVADSRFQGHTPLVSQASYGYAVRSPLTYLGELIFVEFQVKSMGL